LLTSIHRDEVCDPERAGAGGQVLDERCPDAAPLPDVGDRARELRLRRVVGGAHEPRRADALAVPSERDQPLVGVVVDIAQFGQLAGGEMLDRPPVAPKPRERAEVREGDLQLVAVVRGDRPDHDLRAVGQAHRLARRRFPAPARRAGVA
jgi:hypothetical protein